MKGFNFLYLYIQDNISVSVKSEVDILIEDVWLFANSHN